jgi:putative transposase
VDAATKQTLMALVAGAAAAGWSTAAACTYLGLPQRRYYRWIRRAVAGCLDDRTPGGHPVHGLLDAEAAEIVGVFEEWSDVDRSHRKLAHRGSYLGRFWASPSTVRRVLFVADKHFRPLPRPGKSVKKPFPDWVEYRRCQIWIYDTTHFTRAGMAVLAIIDLVTRKWITEVVSAEETSVQVQLGFERALHLEGLDSIIEDRYDDPGVQGPLPPVLLAMSDNGPQMRAGTTAEFMALCSIAQHFGRPGTPTDQAWVETFFGHIKAEYPHLTKIRDPATLRSELAVVREHYNTVRLHEGIGYVTPDDEHEGRGDAIRQARRDGMERARQTRLATHRRTRETGPTTGPGDVG